MTVSLANMSQQNVMSPWVFLQCDGNSLTQSRAFHTAVGWKNQMWIWGGVVSNETNEFAIFDCGSHTWTTLKYSVTKSTPPPLRGHSAAVYSDVLYIFGGIDCHHKLNPRLYQYSFKHNEWAVLDCKKSPPARAYHCLEFSVSLNSFIMYGGEGASNRMLSDLWVFNLEILQWEEVTQLVKQTIEEKPHTVPNPRKSASLVCTDDKAYLYGGTDGRSTFGGNCHILHFDNYSQTGCMEWENHTSDSFPPAERWGHTLNTFGCRMYLFGGKDGTGGKYVVLNDWNRFSFRYQIWVRLSPSGHVPRPRWGHTACVVGNQLLVFGGMNEKGILNDMYLITLSNSTSILSTLSEKRLVGTEPLTSMQMLDGNNHNFDERERGRERKRKPDDMGGCFSIAHHLKSTRFFSSSDCDIRSLDEKYLR